jgi:hypothetical protein
MRRVIETQDPSAAWTLSARRDARRLAKALLLDDDLDARLALGWLYWYRCRARRETFDDDVDLAVETLAPCFAAGIGPLPELLLPSLADAVAPSALRLLEQALDSDDLQSASAAVEVWRRMVAAIPADRPALAESLCNLSAALMRLFELSGALADISEAVDIARQSAEAFPEGHAGRAGSLMNLHDALLERFRHTGALTDVDDAVGVARHMVSTTPADNSSLAESSYHLVRGLRHRYDSTGEAADLDEAVDLCRRTLDTALPDNPYFGHLLTELGLVLHRRFDCSGSLADLDEAIDAGRQVANSTSDSDPEHALMLSNYGDSLRTRFERSGFLTDLDEAIAVIRKAVRSAHSDDRNRAGYLTNLGLALQNRFERTGSLADLDEAVDASRQAVNTAPADHDRRALFLSNLGVVLRIRYDRTGSLPDLDEAIGVTRKAIDSARLDRAGYLTNLSVSLWRRFECTGSLADLDEAVGTSRRAVDVASAHDPGQGGYLSNLGLVLRARFERTGMLTDLDEAIDASRQAVEAVPADHPNRAALLNNLSSALQGRFEATGALADVDEAVRCSREAHQATPADHPDQTPTLSILSLALRKRYERTGELSDLDDAVRTGRQAVDSIPDGHPQRPLLLANLSFSLLRLFERRGRTTDIDDAVLAGRGAVAAVPADHPGRARHLTILSMALRTRFEHTEAPADLEEAIRVGEKAVETMPADHPAQPLYLYNLGNAYSAWFEHTGEGRDAARTAYSRAVSAPAAQPSTQIRAARAAANLAAEAETNYAADLLATAVRLLPKVAPRQLHRGDQQWALGGFSGLAGDAAALTLSAAGTAGPGDTGAARALQLLESGRAVLLSQILETRSDLTALRQHHPELAARFLHLRNRLDAANPNSAPSAVGPAAEGRLLPASDRRHLATEFATTVAAIRGLDGFSSFLLPPEARELLAEARHGPLVMFNISRYRSDALLLTTDGVTCLPLPGLAVDSLAASIDSFHAALAVSNDPEVGWKRRESAQDTLHTILEWLWDNAAEPVLRELGFGTPPEVGASWPRLWWVPGGLLGLLPVHAAGYHRLRPAETQGRTVMDRVISSYTPTVRALRHARRPVRASSGEARALVVAMPTTPDQNPLPHVTAEAALLGERLPNVMPLMETGAVQHPPGSPVANAPNLANVLASLAECSIAHFACHGESDPADPSLSRLLLHDHATSPLTVASLAAVDLDHAELAYLSACSTALNRAADLIDESIHLAAAFQLAGFRHVIATLWEISDALAVDVTNAFYTELKAQDGSLNPRQSAHALHQAVHTMRDRFPHTPSLWASYLHAGA